MSDGTGHKTKIVALGGTAPWSGRVRKIGGWNRTVEVLDDTSLDSEEYEEYIFAELKKHGGIVVEVLVDKATMSLPVMGNPQTWQIIFNSGRVITGTGAIAESTTSEIEQGVRLIETFTLQFNGKTGPTLSSVA